MAAIYDLGQCQSFIRFKFHSAIDVHGQPLDIRDDLGMKTGGKLDETFNLCISCYIGNY